VIHNVKQIEKFSTGPIFILGDLLQPGGDYAEQVLRGLEGVKNQFILELFNPAPPGFIKRVGRACPSFCLEISPESHDPVVRKASGRNYSNEELERTIAEALEAGCSRMDVFFMIGLPRQTPPSVKETVDYCDHLFQRFKGDRRLFFFIAPISPFLDPGSLGFEQPKRYGYDVRFHTLEEHRQALVAPNWKDSLNYETRWMNRQQIADSAYEAILGLNSLKAKYGVIPQGMAEIGEKRVKSAWAMARRIDEAMAGENAEAALAKLKPEIDEINAFPVVERQQLELVGGGVGLRFWRSFWAWLMGR
jgi:hypothetical protein